MGKPPRHWAEMEAEERTDAVRNLGLPAFRAGQISKHYFARYEGDPSAWSDLPAAAREGVAELFPELLVKVTDRVADNGRTVKSLYRLSDGGLVECVLMVYPRKEGARATLCVSSQAGCGIGCHFCATGQAGLQRNLSAGEIIEQVRLAAALLDERGEELGARHVNNVVFMGMGEPLANFPALTRAIGAIVSPVPSGLGTSARGLTVSTVGLVPRIADLAGLGWPVTLAVSLHAPDDELRDELVPINRRWNVAAVLDAAKAYFDATGRRVSVEYALMRDVNDQVNRAGLLAAELNRRGRGWVHVNLIPLNPTPGSPWQASRTRDQEAFQAKLESARIPVTLRDTRGRDIDGACGQLAGKVRAE